MVKPSRYIDAQTHGATIYFLCLRDGNVSTIAVITVSILANYSKTSINQSIYQSVYIYQ